MDDEKCPYCIEGIRHLPSGDKDCIVCRGTGFKQKLEPLSYA
jgi:RecJ-like exonuclease